MSTTPSKIDYNGIQINSQDKDVSITFTMDGVSKGMIFEYDKNTTPKTFKIAIEGYTAGMYYNDGSTANVTSLEEISLLQTLLSSLEIPPNSTTLSVNNNIRLQNGVNTADLGNTAGNLNINVSGPTGQVVFNQAPQCGITATNANDLTNKTYVDNIYNIINTNENANYYPLFVTDSGAGITLNADILSGPFTYNPSTGSMKTPALILEGGETGNIRMGSVAGITATTFGTNCIALGTNAGLYQGNNCIAIGQNSGSANAFGVTAQTNNCIAIGTNTGRYIQGQHAIAIGVNAGNTGQGEYAISIGTNSGNGGQKNYAIAIGAGAGQNNQGSYSIAIGANAGQTNQAANSIVINGTSSTTNNGVTGSCVIRPIRRVDVGGGNTGRIFYNASTFEMTYSGT